MNKKVIAIIIAIILLIIILVTAITKNNPKNEEIQKIPDDVEMDKDLYKATYSLEKVENIANMITVNNCVNSYINYIYKKDSKALYEISIDDYLESNSINENNILNDVVNITEQCNYKADKVYEYDNGMYLKTYFVFGKILDTQNKKQLKSNFTLNVDSRNRTMEIAPLEKVYKNYIADLDGNEIKINEEKFKEKVKDIKPNNSNFANIAEGVGEMEVLRYYYEQYILDMLYDTENAYNLLDKAYKEKRFGNYEVFVQYVEQNKEDLEKGILTKYSIRNISGYTEYLCQDSLNNCYIFKEVKPMEYTVFLDQYTVNDQIFVESYNSKNEQDKAYMNLNKFLQMINRQDYDSAYSVLSDEFKEKHFQTKEEFIRYMQEKFFKYNGFDYLECTGASTEFVIKTNVSDVKNNNYEETFTKRFVVYLSDGLNYKIAFNI